MCGKALTELMRLVILQVKTLPYGIHMVCGKALLELM